MHLKSSAGFTLLELMITVAMIGILAGISTGIFPDILKGWRLKDAANRVLEDVRDAQNEAMRIGDYASINTGGGRRFRQQGIFLVFDTAGGSYKAMQWIDGNDNGYPDADPTDPVPTDPNKDSQRLLFTRSLPNGSSFSSGPATTFACSATGTINPATPKQITFDSSGYEPCAGKPCIQFDAQGSILNFGSLPGTTDKGNIYLTDGNKSWAVNSLAPGSFRLCHWNGTSWN